VLYILDRKKTPPLHYCSSPFPPFIIPSFFQVGHPCCVSDDVSRPECFCGPFSLRKYVGSQLPQEQKVSLWIRAIFPFFHGKVVSSFLCGSVTLRRGGMFLPLSHRGQVLAGRGYRKLETAYLLLSPRLLTRDFRLGHGGRREALFLRFRPSSEPYSAPLPRAIHAKLGPTAYLPVLPPALLLKEYHVFVKLNAGRVVLSEERYSLFPRH